MPQYSDEFYIYSIFLCMAPLGILLLIISQIVSIRIMKIKLENQTKRIVIILFCFYSISLICSLVGLSMHFSETHEAWCQKYGMSCCFALWGGSKAILFYFFVARAKYTKLTVHKKNAARTDNQKKCDNLLFNWIAPIILMVYWSLYCIMTTILFQTGSQKVYITSSNLSFCIFNDVSVKFVIIAGLFEVFISISLLLLFIHPLKQAINRLKELKYNGDDEFDINDDQQEDNDDLVKLLKWNVILSAISAFSSCFGVVILPFTSYYLWVICLYDPLINSICVFFMIGYNRQFCSKICNNCNGYKNKQNGFTPIGNRKSSTSSTV